MVLEGGVAVPSWEGFSRKMDSWGVGLDGVLLPGRGRFGERPAAAAEFQGLTSLQDRLCQGQRFRSKRHLAWLLFLVNLKDLIGFESDCRYEYQFPQEWEGSQETEWQFKDFGN